MKKGQPSSKKNKYWIDRTDINEDAFIFLRGSKWHLHIAKQPHWKAPVNKSMDTADKGKALIKGAKAYEEILILENSFKTSFFSPEELILVGRRKAIGNLAEDKFKNLMMVKGYEVYKPVEDIWGSDFVLKKGDEFLTIQVESSQQEKPTWSLQANNGVKYKDTCTHMAFVHLKEYKSSGLWLIPTKELPDASTMSHVTFKKVAKEYEIELKI